MVFQPNLAFGHPEIEHLDYFDLQKYLQGIPDVETSVDSLELWKVGIGTSARQNFEHQHRPNLPHLALVEHINGTANHAQKDSTLALRILFLKSTQLKSQKTGITASIDNSQVALSKLTMDYLIEEMGVSPLFISNITSVPWVLGAGNSLFRTYDSANRKTRTLKHIRGFFHSSDGGRPVHVWFQHNLQKKMSTYIIYGCPERVQTTIHQWAADPGAQPNLLRILAVDSLIIDDVAWKWSKAVVESAKELLEYEHYSSKENMARLDSAVQSLHCLSQHFHILQEELNSIVEQLDYLIDIYELLSKARPIAPISCVDDSLRLMRARTHKWHRSVTNWKERTQIRINLFFNLSAQRDNFTNMNVAQLTSEIAKATYRHSSSMIIIAVLTLIFLPGTFVAGVFSMPFVQSLVPGTGWQLYLGITAPLTLCVLLGWNLWSRYRDRSEPKLSGLQSLDAEVHPAISISTAHLGPELRSEPEKGQATLDILVPPRSPSSPHPHPHDQRDVAKELVHLDSSNATDDHASISLSAGNCTQSETGEGPKGVENPPSHPEERRKVSRPPLRTQESRVAFGLTDKFVGHAGSQWVNKDIPSSDERPSKKKRVREQWPPGHELSHEPQWAPGLPLAPEPSPAPAPAPAPASRLRLEKRKRATGPDIDEATTDAPPSCSPSPTPKLRLDTIGGRKVARLPTSRCNNPSSPLRDAARGRMVSPLAGSVPTAGEASPPVPATETTTTTSNANAQRGLAHADRQSPSSAARAGSPDESLSRALLSSAQGDADEVLYDPPPTPTPRGRRQTHPPLTKRRSRGDSGRERAGDARAQPDAPELVRKDLTDVVAQPQSIDTSMDLRNGQWSGVLRTLGGSHPDKLKVQADAVLVVEVDSLEDEVFG